MLSASDMEKALQLLATFKMSENEAEQLTVKIIEAYILEQRASLDLYRKLEALLAKHAKQKSELQAEIAKRSEALGRQAAELTELRMGRIASDAQEQRIASLEASSRNHVDRILSLQEELKQSEHEVADKDKQISELEDEKAILGDKLDQAQKRLQELLGY